MGKLSKKETLEALEKAGYETKDGKIEVIEGDSFKAGCDACGKCCRNREDIVLKITDIYTMSKSLNIEPYELLNKYCKSHIGNSSNIPVMIVNFKDQFFGKTVCPFLKNKGNGVFHCRVHEGKPQVCRIYPLGRFGVMGEDFSYFKQDVNCYDKKNEKTYTFGEWFGEDYSLIEEWLAVFYDLLGYINDTINLKKLWEVAKIRDTERFVHFALIGTIYIPKMCETMEESLKEYKETRFLMVDDFAKALKRDGYNVSKK